ncbi:MAG: ATP-binding protein [Desulfuromonadaceae bacterium]|nr:ATP-binding protein [Desulfuromonadaceae bacterium]MDD2855563.1 ATP-binding protein [Desulfuromonadaceae bacterium]
MAENRGLERRLKLFIYARILVSFLFLLSTILLQLQNSIDLSERFNPGITRLMAFSFLFSITSLFILKKFRFTTFLTNLQIIWDISFVTVLVLFTGGILSPYSFLYLLSILIAGMLLGRQQALYTASLCGILYGTILDFQYFGYLGFIGLSQDDAYQFGALRLFYTIAFNLIAFGLTAFVTGLLAERASLSEEALKRSSIDYFELDQLNSAIVAHSDSGILTTTIEGNIRVFNPYAESIVGLSQSDVYNLKIEQIFPQLADIFDQKDNGEKQEFEYKRADSTSMTLGYRTASFNDSNGLLRGYIVNFRDITEMRRMETALKKADRLAALGELSARMAHEIRNPLAALCGSVQLLSNTALCNDADVRLLTIVTREAARLETLISEFLMYARPAKPEMKEIQLKKYVDEIIMFLINDGKFEGVKIKNALKPNELIAADPDQLRQVIINLLQNAADAMERGGEIVIEYSDSCLSITDDGSGINEDSAKHLFEPFWTTKPTGTGLGLAISYRIIEAHGGSISFETPASGGCRFNILLTAQSKGNS